jgi:hypothetical protein
MIEVTAVMATDAIAAHPIAFSYIQGFCSLLAGIHGLPVDSPDGPVVAPPIGAPEPEAEPAPASLALCCAACSVVG